MKKRILKVVVVEIVLLKIEIKEVVKNTVKVVTN